MTTAVPIFAVVGRVNKGKSSVLATLAEDDTVRVDPRPGTTRDCRRYPVRIDGEDVIVIVDTPGFEEADRALAWLRERETSAANRADLVREFVRTHADGEDFAEERKLLAPIVEGACVLYVVDGAQPYRPNYEAEMEILRWTGRPSMALVNRIGPEDHGGEWHRALEQYFRIVRDFDAHRAGFGERIRLLRTFRELRDEWREPLDRAIAALCRERERRRLEATSILTDLIIDALTFSLEINVREATEIDTERTRLEQRFHDALREREQRGRRAIEQLYEHRRGAWASSEIERPAFDRDLFAEETWRLLGLSPKQQVAVGALGGAVVGGSIDAAVGGASFLTGTVVGTLVGGGVALYGALQRLARARPLDGGGVGALLGDVSRFWSGTRRYRVGPHRGGNFPWVLLDRALMHYRAVLDRTHAVRATVRISDDGAGDQIVRQLSREDRSALETHFRSIRRQHRDVGSAVRSALHQHLREMVDTLDPDPE